MSQSQGEDGPREGDTLRVLVSTDNHLGYAEKDPVRGNDSFRSFREILQLAQRENVDLLLLGGDLFHENKPSRHTLYETMRLLRTHCMGDGAVNFQVVSDQSINFPNFGVVNFEDPNYNVELPVFSIHGNHDDPARGGGGATLSLAALDVLSAANLVNYFGKSEKVDAVEVFPVLLTKGNTRVAIYGLGNMRDERLNRMFAQGKVMFRRPVERAEEWFSIFVVHQNRDDKGRGSKNCVPESVIPDFIDLVVWGHEHECLIDVQESVKGDFFITQPGSSVATSLVEGEAKQKHVAVLEINGQSFRMSNHELHTVRPFKMGEVILNEIEELDPNDPDVADHIREYLEGRVKELLHEAELEQEERRRERTREREKRQQESPFPLPEIVNGSEEEKELVLIRLRVEHTGFPVLVNQRFGATFVGKVANPNDILLFHRRKKDRIIASDKNASKELEKSLLGRPVRPTPLASVTIEDILSKQLCVPERKLVLLPEAQLGIALEKFTLKNNSSAIQEFVDSVLEETQRELSSKDDAKSTQDILSVVGKKKEQTDALHALQKEEEEEAGNVDLDTAGNSLAGDGFQSRRVTPDEETSPKSPKGRFGTPRSSAKKASPKKKPVRKSVFSDLEDDSDDSPQKKNKPPTPRKPPARSARTKTKTTREALLSDDDEGFVGISAEDDGDEDFKMEEDDDEEMETPRPSAKSRRTTTKAKKSPPKAKKASPKARKSPMNRKRLRKSNDSDEEEDDVFASPLNKRAATKRSSQANGVLDLCSDSEPENPAPKKRVKQTKSKISQQHKIDNLFKKQAQAKEDEDDVEEDQEFTQVVRPADARGQDIVGPTQSQSDSQMSQPTRRKLPLSMVAASQSQSQQPKRGGTAVAARKGWGRSRR